MVVQEGGLDALAGARRSYATAEAKLCREILAAHEAGSSLRAIALVVEMAPETVRMLVAKTRDERERDLATIERLGSGLGLSVEATKRAKKQRRALQRKWGLSV